MLHRCWILLFCLSAVLPLETAAAPVIHIATSDSPPLSRPDDTGFLDLMIKEALGRIGMELKIVHLPAERSLVNANEGVEQGVYARVRGMDQLYPNLVLVPEQIVDFEFVAFTTGVKAAIDGWESLRPYEVGIVRGWKILEMNVRSDKGVKSVKSPEILFDMLLDGRVELIVYNRINGRGLIKDRALRGVTVLDPPLAVREMFLYLHKSQEALVPRLTEAIRSIKRDGTCDRLQQSVLNPYLQRETAF
ncbi:MAG: substrate-binding periplasmic protein [Syntrophobacteraceae bacterium]